MARAFPPISRNPTAHVRDLLARWREQDNTRVVHPALVEGVTATAALFRRWDEEDSRLAEPERRAEEALCEAFK